ncbi:alpha-1-antitrypsin-like isoform X2 [Pleurodeles waltl]
MKPAIYLYLVISVLHGMILCDHHQDHDEKDHHHHKNHHGHDPIEHEQPGKQSMACHKIASRNAEFAFNLYKQISKGGSSDNVFFSPVSISTVISMLSLGAKSLTFDQIIAGLGFNLTDTSKEEIYLGFQHLLHVLNNPNSELQLNIANALFIDNNLKVLPKFTEDVKKYYDSEAFSSDFTQSEEAKKQINDYVEKHTNGKIVDLLQSLDHSTQMVLVNCIFFKGKWEHVFDANLTKEATFSVDKNTTVRVPMMEREGVYNSWRDHDLSCVVVRLNYGGNASAFFILPDEGKMNEVEEGLSSATLQKWWHTHRERTFNLHLPKFSISATTDLRAVLEKLGMTDVFSDMANLSGITGHNNLKASKVVHKAVLSIDEQGTEASGATAIEIKPRFIPRPIIFNRPFVLSIVDSNTQSLIFIGKVINPTKV